MARVVGMALATPCGDLAATVAALSAGTARPGRLSGILSDCLIALGRQALSGRKPDLVLFATTKADLGTWCDDLLAATSNGIGGPTDVARRLGAAFSCKAFAISAACASGTVALGIAGRLIALGTQRVLVIGGDRLAPFVEDGFGALRAIDPNGCHPFDADRAGLALGETFSAVALENSSGDVHLQGWGASMDANHLTGPSRDGDGLARACRSAMRKADVDTPALVVAHGTGTRYNDDAESLAYAAVCPSAPTVGYKGGLGHSLGASGVSEFVIACDSLRRGATPGTLGLRKLGCAGGIPVLPPGEHPMRGESILVANAGFGGINGAVVVGKKEARSLAPIEMKRAARIEFDRFGWSKDGSTGRWNEQAAENELPILGAREILGRIDAMWGRMDLASRLLVALGVLIGPIPEDAGIILLTERGCAATDRAYELRRRDTGADPQMFPYTLPSTPIGEASIRLKAGGPGFAALGASDDDGRLLAHALIADGTPVVLLARVEADRPPHLAWAELWMRPA